MQALRGPKRRACACLLHGPRERSDDPSLRPRPLPSASRPLCLAQGISPRRPAVQAESQPLPGRLPLPIIRHIMHPSINTPCPAWGWSHSWSLLPTYPKTRSRKRLGSS